MISLCKTINNKTGTIRWFIDGKRVSKIEYEFAQIRYKQWACIHSTTTKTLTRHYMTVGDTNHD